MVEVVVDIIQRRAQLARGSFAGRRNGGGGLLERGLGLQCEDVRSQQQCGREDQVKEEVRLTQQLLASRSASRDAVCRGAGGEVAAGGGAAVCRGVGGGY